MFPLFDLRRPLTCFRRSSVSLAILAALSSPALSCPEMYAVCFETLGAQDAILSGGSADGNFGAGAISAGSQGLPYIADGFSTGTTLPLLPGYASGRAVAVNNFRYAAGYSFQPSASGGYGEQAVRWDSSGAVTGLGFLPQKNSSSATGMSDNADVIVGYSFTNPSPLAFRWVNDIHGGAMTSLGTLPGDTQSAAYAVSRDGSIVVGVSAYIDPNGGFNTDVYRAFRWVSGTMTAISGVPSGNGFTPSAVTNDGSVIIFREGNRWVNGVLTSMGLAASSMFPPAMSADGSVVGGASDIGGAARWTVRDGVKSIKDLLIANGNTDVVGWTLTGVVGVSADGKAFVGNGTDPQGRARGWRARLPLPTGAPHDFNGNGSSDIFWRNTGGSNVLWLMNGATASSVTSLGGVDTSWTVVGQRDFDGDGKTDILWRNSGGSNAIWLMNGATVSSVSLIGGVDTSWSVVGTGDLNGDGKGDIIWRNTSGTVAIWLMNGATVSSVAVLGGIGTNWSVAGTADFDGDGKGDILWRENGGSNAIWFMNGAAIASVSLIGGVGTSWTVAGTADFNGDGKGDILWREAGGSNAVWFMNGATVASVSLIGGVGTTWSVASVGDYNGDGKGDILWREQGGSNAIWQMNGATVSSVSLIGGVANNWSVMNAGAN